MVESRADYPARGRRPSLGRPSFCSTHTRLVRFRFLRAPAPPAPPKAVAVQSAPVFASDTRIAWSDYLFHDPAPARFLYAPGNSATPGTGPGCPGNRWPSTPPPTCPRPTASFPPTSALPRRRRPGPGRPVFPLEKDGPEVALREWIRQGSPSSGTAADRFAPGSLFRRRLPFRPPANRPRFPPIPVKASVAFLRTVQGITLPTCARWSALLRPPPGVRVGFDPRDKEDIWHVVGRCRSAPRRGKRCPGRNRNRPAGCGVGTW